MPDWRNLRWLWVSATVVVLDLWTKWLAEANLERFRPVEVLPFFNLRLTYNPGAAFSLLADAGGWQRWFFALVAVVASVVILVWLVRLRGERMVACGLTLVLGGALGNLWDRIFRGEVVDFLDFHWAGWHFPAFNVADMAITVGAALLILDLFLHKDTHEH